MIYEHSALTEGVYYILLSLVKPMHGYGIMQNISQMSAKRINIGPGTLYGAINSLLEKGLIRSYGQNGNSRKKEYIITDTGKIVLEHELIRLNELIDNGNLVMKENFNGQIN